MTSCLTEKNEVAINASTIPNQIVLIFKDFPEAYTISLNDTKGEAYTPARPDLKYYDEQLIQRIINPKTGTNDTIVIPCNRNSIEFQHNVKGFDNFDYIFLKGDTVVFTYKEKIPTAKITNRVISDFETNYDWKQREIVCSNDYPALFRITMPFMFITYNSINIGQEGERQGILGQIDKIKNNAQYQFNKELELERNLLDSLLSETLISNESYIWLNNKLKIKEATVKVYNDILDRNEVKLISLNDSDSLLAYHAYRTLLTNISSTLYERKIKRIISPNSNLPNYKIVYDSILDSELFTSKAKEILLFETSNSLIQNSGATKINEHLKKIKNHIVDTVLISYLVEKHELKYQISKELELVALDGSKTTLTNLIEENTDQIVYIDIWASWCSPCIEEFPHSKILTDKLRGKNVKFIYLSIDYDRNKWEASSKKHNLPDEYSFLVQNKKTSKFLERIDFSSIPRYLIFNKAGDLEYSNAPRPGEGETIKIIEGLLRSNP